MVIERRYVVDTQKPLELMTLRDTLVAGDQNAHKFMIALTEHGEAMDVEGSVLGYFVRSDGQTFALVGTVEDNAACVVLPGSCYEVPGFAQLVVKVTKGSETLTVFAATMQVMRSQTDAVVDPQGVIPTLEQLLEKIRDMEDATGAARAASGKTDAIAALVPYDLTKADLGWVRGGIQSADGQETPSGSANRARTVYISTHGVDSVQVNVDGQQYALFFYDANRAFMAPWTNWKTAAATIPVPAGAAYFRILAGKKSGDGNYTVDGVADEVTVTAAEDLTIVKALRSLLDAVSVHEDALVELADMIGG